MRKKVLRVVAGATLMMAMAIGVQMNKAQQSKSSLMMENLEAIAMGGGELAYGCYYTGNWFSRCDSGMFTTITNCMPSSWSTCGY